MRATKPDGGLTVLEYYYLHFKATAPAANESKLARATKPDDGLTVLAYCSMQSTLARATKPDCGLRVLLALSGCRPCSLQRMRPHLRAPPAKPDGGL